MKKWVIAVLVIFAVLVSFSAVLAINTMLFTSKQTTVSETAKYPFNVDDAAARFSKTLQFKTISDSDQSKTDFTEFVALDQHLQTAFPLVHSKLERRVINEHSFLYIWKGTDPTQKPILIYAHQDVVAAPLDGWTHPPFSGDIADGYIWGRGAIDDKVTLHSVLEATEYLLQNGFQPKRSIYLAFGHDEEVGGANGAKKIAEYLKSLNIQFEFIQEEGLPITKDIMPGIEKPIALVGIAEKGYMTLELEVKAKGGHSSMPPQQTAIGILAAAINNIQNRPLPAHMSNVMGEAFKYLGPEMEFPFNMIFANTWLFNPLLEAQFSSSPVTNAMIRTTAAPDVISGGILDCVLPPYATALINFRIAPGDSIESVLEYVKTTINDPRVTINRYGQPIINPSPISSTTSWSFNKIVTSIQKVMPDVIVTPFLMIAASDGPYFAELTPDIYRFWPIRLYGNDIDSIHGVNERISLQSYGEAISYYIQLIKNTCE